jgi:hypothetical protein
MSSNQNLIQKEEVVFGRIYGIWDRQKQCWRYVGQTRRRDDYTPHGKVISPAFASNPTRYEYVIIHESESIAQSRLNNLEMGYIILRGTLHKRNPEGLNFILKGYMDQRSVSQAALSQRSRRPTPEQIQRMRDAWTPERRAALSAKRTGRTLTPETRAKLRQSQSASQPARFAKLRQNPEDWSAVQERARANGAKSTSEHQLSSCDKLKQDPERWARWQEQARINGNHLKAREHLINLNKARKGKPLSEATRQKMREARARQLTTSPSPPHGRL